jgi:hypothetical protein
MNPLLFLAGFVAVAFVALCDGAVVATVLGGGLWLWWLRRRT